MFLCQDRPASFGLRGISCFCLCGRQAVDKRVTFLPRILFHGLVDSERCGKFLQDCRKGKLLCIRGT